MANQGKINLKLASLNCRGLDNNKKRTDVFDWIKSKKIDICALQETHSQASNNNIWEHEWGYKCFFSNNNSQSRGVAFLFNNSFEFTINKEEVDTEGRYIILDITISSNRLILVNVYGPNEDNPEFFNKLRNKISTLENSTIIATGDWNTVMDYNKDTLNYKHQNNPKSRQKLLETMEELDLIDIWRTANPEKRRYTWHGPNTKLARLDYFLISSDVIENVIKTDTIPGYRSDHSLIYISLSFTNQPRGRGIWKFNNSLLRDAQYIQIIKYSIAEVIEQYKLPNQNNDIEPKDLQFSINDQLLFETLKLTIRTKTIPYAAQKKRERLQNETNIEKLIQEAEENFNKKPTQNNKAELEEHQQTLEQIRQNKVEGLITRAKAKWYSEGERCTRYFCNLEKRHFTEKIIPKLIINENREFFKIDEILQAQKEFYENLFKSTKPRIIREQEEIFLDRQNPFLNFLDEFQKASCEGNIELGEIKTALKSMKNNKSPGSDGFTAEFYKFFWLEIHPYLLRSIRYAFDHGELSITQQQGVITCLPKPNRPKYFLKNWRPITLLNVDYKLASTVIANRIKPLLKHLISDTQKGYVKGRYIGECTRLVFDLIEKAEEEQIPGLLVLLDFEKAFDSLEWSYMQKVLKFFGFGNDFCKWISIFYSNIKSCILNNGHCSTYFSLERGVRQGDPLAAYLFIIVLETLSAAIKFNPQIKGIEIDDTEILLSQYADDSTLALDYDEKNLKEVIDILEKFQNVSGLKINVEKTEIIRLGSIKDSTETLLPEIKLNWNNKKKFTLLGITYDLNKQDITEENFIKARKKIDNLLANWTLRTLTLKGKVTIVKSLALSQLVHLLMVLPAPKEFLSDIQKAFFRFIWDKGRDKIKRNIMYLPHDKGGLSVPNIELFSKTIKLVWIKKLMDINDTSPWKMLILNKLNKYGGNYVWYCSVHKLQELTSALNPFWRSVFESWSIINKKEIITPQDMLSQPLWYNKEINRNDKYIPRKALMEAGINFVNDLTNHNGTPLNQNEFQLKYNININFMAYHAMIQTIPTAWNVEIRQYGKKLNSIKNNNLEIIKSLRKPNKYFYLLLIENLQQTTTIVSHTKWEEILEENQLNWDYHHSLPFKITVETKLQTFQFKILHRILVTNKKLLLFKIRINDRCTFCEINKETITHLFWNCHHVKSIWLQTEDWINEITHSRLKLNQRTIILGDPEIDENKPMNHILLIIKYYIYTCRCKEIIPNFEGAKQSVHKVMKLEI